MRTTALLIAVVLLPASLVAQPSILPAAQDSAVVGVVREFYRATAQHRWNDAVGLLHPQEVERHHARALVWLLSWARTHDSVSTLPPLPGNARSRTPPFPTRMLAAVDSALLARHAATALPRFAPGATLASVARSDPRDVVERLVALKWTMNPVTGMPRVHGVSYEGDTVAHAQLRWGSDTGEDPYRSFVLHLRRWGRDWRLVAGPPLLYQSELATYAIPRTDLPPLGPDVTFTPIGRPSPGPEESLGTTMSVSASARAPRIFDPALMSGADSAYWSRVRRLVAVADTFTVDVPRIALTMGDSMTLHSFGALARDARGNPIREIPTSWRIEGRAARLAAGRVIGVMPGEATLVVSTMLPSADSGQPTEVPPRLRATIPITVTPTTRLVAATSARVASSLGSASSASWNGRFYSSLWKLPGGAIRGDTVYLRAITVNVGPQSVEATVRACGGIALASGRGLRLSGRGLERCPTTTRTLAPGDSVIGEAWAVVDGDVGSHELRWWVARHAHASEHLTSLQVDSAGGRAPVRGDPPDPSSPDAARRGPHTRQPWLRRVHLGARAVTGVSVSDVESVVRQVLSRGFRTARYAVSEEAFARTADVPQLLVTFSFPDSAAAVVSRAVVRRERLPDGTWRERRTCERALPIRYEEKPVRGALPLAQLALSLRDLVEQLERGDEYRP